MTSVVVLGLLILLAACSGGPASYGITGPGARPPPAPRALDGPDPNPTPGVSTSGTSYGPNMAPDSGSSGFWGYN